MFEPLFLRSYGTYNRIIRKIFGTVLIIRTVLIIGAVRIFCDRIVLTIEFFQNLEVG